MPERILWLVDEYVMKSELTERLVPIIERAHNLAVSSTGRTHSREAAWSLRGPRQERPLRRITFLACAALEEIDGMCGEPLPGAETKMTTPGFFLEITVGEQL